METDLKKDQNNVTNTEQPSSSILSQISNVQHGLEQQYYRVEVLEKALAYREMSVDEREAMEAELDAIKKLLITNEKSLRKLQSENRQTVSVAGLFIFLCVAVFLIYTVLTNTN